MAKITETRKTADVLLSNVNITIEPIYFSNTPTRVAIHVCNCNCSDLLQHLFSSIAPRQKIRIQIRPDLLNLRIVSELYNPAINHIGLRACQSPNADQPLLSFSQKHHYPLPQNTIIRKRACTMIKSTHHSCRQHQPSSPPPLCLRPLRLQH